MRRPLPIFVNAWVKTAKQSGAKFFSLLFKAMDARRAAAADDINLDDF